MGGGLMQLVAYGAQDIYLTGNPQITFFKVVYRRHTNFSMECIEQTINGSTVVPAVGATGQGTVTISRNGDLLGALYVNLPGTSATDGQNVVNEVRLEIGGQEIDKQNNEWMQVWTELSTPESKALGLKAMQASVGTGSTTGVNEAMIPLQFWFCRNPGLALPLIALQYHEVKVKCTWQNGVAGGADLAGANGNIEMWADYIYLDTDERRRFAQVSHEYLIEQVQTQAVASINRAVRLNFNHPVKELIWTTAPGAVDGQTAKLTLNGHDRFSTQTKEYFQLRQPYQHHTAVPRNNLPPAAQTSLLDRQVSFATPTNHPATALGDVTAAADSSLLITATGAASVIGFAAAPTAGEFAVGQQIAFICTVSAGAAANGVAGNVYFSTVTTAGTVAGNQVTVGLTVPITADSTPVTLVTAASTGAFVVRLVSNGNSAQARTSQMTNAINVYSFGLKPEEHQPSGTCNFSRIDSAFLNYSAGLGAGGVNNVFAHNYNVLRVMSGMGGLAYSN